MLAARISWFILAFLTTGFAADQAQGADKETIFEETFADNPHSRFKMLPVSGANGSSEGSGKYDDVKHAYSLGGYLSLVRPVVAGAHVEWSVKLQFEPAANATSLLETQLKLVLRDQSLAGVNVQRSAKVDVPGKIQFVRQQQGQNAPKVLKEIPLPVSLDGTWLLRYRHGLITLSVNSKTLGSVDLSALGVPVAGVSWTQKGGTVICQHMALQGEPMRKLEASDQEKLQQASRLNQEARQLYVEKKSEEALSKMKEASALFVQVHGENHHDSGNSFTNLASILQAMRKTDEAEQYQTKALTIHEASLGASHPHTTLTRFNLGKLYMDKGDRTKAKEQWTRCRTDWKDVYGPDFPLVKSLDSILAGLE